MGAEYFESMLIDHDISTNWGNWLNSAGLTGKRTVRVLTDTFAERPRSVQCGAKFGNCKHPVPTLMSFCVCDMPADFLHIIADELLCTCIAFYRDNKRQT